MSQSQIAALPKRVLHVHNSADIYGASRMLLRWVKSMDRRRFETIVVLPEDGPLKKLLEAEKVDVILHPRLSVITRPVFRSWRIILFLLNYPVSVFFFWRLTRQRRIDLVYTNTGVMVSPALAAWLARVPHVWHIRESFQEFQNFWPLFSWFITHFSFVVIAVSNPIANQFRSLNNIVVIHDGFSPEEFLVPKENLRAEFQTRYHLAGHFVVGCVGRIKLVRKGQEFLVRATALLKQRGLSIKALIVGVTFPGNESHLEQIRRMVIELGIEDNVVFTGELPDTRAAYAAMDVLALTSAQPEPFGNVVMEAMGMGLPVIATNIGGSLDQVVDGATGFLIPPANPEALAEAIEKLMKNPELRQRMGIAAVERLHKNFSLAEMTQKIERVFDGALKK
ncbi:MAG TPA: glycosyltransferase [Verrucomicrobiae bacterium]|jgi:glycosyltransferase involved in cell wall biosynthesis